MKKINPFLFSWLISIVAMSGSLFLSEVVKFVPCAMCWYQRILMYPLVIFFAFGYIKRDLNIYLYTYPLVLMGNILSFYHYGVQKLGFYYPIDVCTTGVECNTKYIEWFGFITIPFLSLVAFTLIHIFILFYYFKNKKEKSGQ